MGQRLAPERLTAFVNIQLRTLTDHTFIKPSKELGKPNSSTSILTPLYRPRQLLQDQFLQPPSIVQECSQSYFSRQLNQRRTWHIFIRHLLWYQLQGAVERWCDVGLSLLSPESPLLDDNNCCQRSKNYDSE